MSLINAEAQAIIDHLRAVDPTKPHELDKQRVQLALSSHLKALKQPTRPIRWVVGGREVYETVIKMVRDAAWWAAWGAARDAARDAAWGAARDAAWGAAWGAARDAARDAAWGAAWGAARDAARDAAITNSLYDHPKFAEWSAIWKPFLDAYEAGLDTYWPTTKEILAVPRPLLRMRDGRLHADGHPAVEWPNGEKYYFWRGTLIPDNWGKVSSEHWRPNWLLETKNQEQRRVLIQGLGYDRIKAALPTTVLHTDRDMELVRIEKAVDVEPIVVLKVVCPSTGRPYVLRVPPTMTRCEPARKWTLGQEADPLEFVQET